MLLAMRYVGYSPSVRSKWLDIGQVLFCVVHKSSHLNQTHLVNKRFIVWFWGKCFCRALWVVPTGKMAPFHPLAQPIRVQDLYGSRSQPQIEMLSCLEGKRCLHAVKKSTLDVSFTSSHFGRVWLRMDHSGAFLELSLQKTTFKYLEAITI